MKNLVKKTAAGVFVAGLTFGFAPAAVAADATPACYVDAVEQAEINYSKQNSIKVQAEAEKADAAAKKANAAAKKADAEKRVKAKEGALKSAKKHLDEAKTADEVKLYTSIFNMTKAQHEEASKDVEKASQALKDASYDVQAAEDTIALQTNMLKTASDALNKIQNADPAAYNKAHGCKVAPAKPDQKPGKDVKPGKDGKVDTKAQNTKKDGKKAPVKVKKNAKTVKGGLAHTGAVAASLAGLAVASVAGGTGVVAWRRRKA